RGGVGEGTGGADARLHGPSSLTRHSGLPIRAVPDRSAGPRAHLRRVVRAAVRRGAGAVFDGAAHRLGDDLLRHDFRGRGDRRVHPAGLWPRDRRPARNRHRGSSGVGLKTGRSSDEASEKPPQDQVKLMAETRSAGPLTSAAGHVLGRKLDSIPFSRYHMTLIAVLSLVGFVDGYDLVMTGSLLVLAKQPLHLTPDQIRYLAVASTMMIVVGGFIASAISDHYSRKTIMVIGVAGITFCTLLITVVQTGEQLIIVRLLTGLAGGFAVIAPFPIATELMPARHRRTYSAVYEMALACSFAVLPFVGFLLAGNPNAF